MRSRAVAVLAVVTLIAAACSSSGGHTGASPTSKDVSFDVAGTTTYGTLEMPAHADGKRVAAALLLAGSGPTDRDGNQPPTLTPNTLELIADVLAKQGIASLRFDKYFSGQTGAGAFAADPGSITVSAFLKQADAAYDYLRKQPGVDSSKMLVVGHSEGGEYALLAATSVRPQPAGLALVEPADERFLDVLQQQLDAQLQAGVRVGGLTSAMGTSDQALVGSEIADFRAGRPVTVSTALPQSVSSTLAGILTGTNAAYTRSLDPIVPAQLAAKVKRGTRVLVTDGTRDTKIPTSTIGPLARALRAAGTTGPGLKIIKNTDHDLHLPDEPQNDSVLAPDFVAAVQDWARPFAS